MKPIKPLIIISFLSDLVKEDDVNLSEIKQSTKPFLTAAEVAEVLQCDPQLLRWQAKNAPCRLGFPVVVIKSRVKIPRQAFINFMEGKT